MIRQVQRALAIVAIACLPTAAFGQAVSGTILGTVTDSSGAVMAKAKITIVNEGTGLTRTLTADTNGEYTAPSLPTGRYTLIAEAAGFKTLTMSNVELGVDQRARIDLKLEVGALNESVTITGASPLVQTSSSELGTTVTDEQIETLPLNGRNFVNLTRTVPGVLRGIPGANIDGAGSLAWRASASFSANGQRPRDNNFMLDGVDNNETWLQTVVIFPSVDALDEFKLQTSTYSAEFGRSLGGVVNLQIKSGTNKLHGSGFEFHRDDAFDANNFFNNRAGRAKPDFKQNQFGGTVGGPVFKDKTFFFASYQGHRENQGQTFLSTVPTAAMRAGDFSELTRVIFDPLTGQAFPGNVIPAARIDTVAKNILTQLYPEPNTAGTRQANGQTINNYLINPIKTRQDNQFDVKVDHNLTSTNRFFVRYSFQKTHRVQPATLPHGDAGATFGAGVGDIKAQSLAFNDTQTFSNRWLNEFRFGWSSIKFFMTPIDYGTNPANAVGLPGINLNLTTSGFTQLTFQNIRNLGANSNQPLITNQNDFQFFDNVTWNRGKHTVKMGGSFTPRSREILNADTIVGQFGFNNNMTSNCAGQGAGCTVNSATGFDVASFMLGLTSAKNRNLFDAGTYTEKRPEISTYVQDDFRVNHKLTLNLGLRWDVYPPWVEIKDRQSNFDESTGTFVVASDDAVINGVKVGRYLQTYSKRDLGPRFGFAYDLAGDAKTVVRGGFGIFWNFTPGGTSSSKAQNPPFLQSTALTPTPTAYGSNLLLKDGLPAPPGVDPNRPAAGATRSIFDVNFRDATRGSGTSTSSAASARTTWSRSPTSDRRAGRCSPRAIPIRRKARGGGDGLERQPALRGQGAGPAVDRAGAEQGHARLQRPAGEVPAAVREQLLVPELLHLGQGDRPELRQRRHGHADQRLRPRIQPRSGRLRHHAHALVELDLRAAVGAREALRRVADERHPVPARRPAADRHADTGRAVDRHRQPAEPDLRRQPLEPDDRPVVRHVLLRAADRHHRHLRRRGPRDHPRTRLVQHRRVAHQEHQDRTLRHRDPGRGVQRAQPPAVRQSEHDDRQRGGGHHLGHAVEPVLLAVRHHRASGAARRQGQVLNMTSAYTKVPATSRE